MRTPIRRRLYKENGSDIYTGYGRYNYLRD